MAPQQQQVELPVQQDDGHPNSSITTTISLSDGLLSLTHSASEEVSQAMHIQPMDMGLLNVSLAYHAEDEEEDLQMDNNLQLNDEEQNIFEGQVVGSVAINQSAEMIPTVKEGGEPSTVNQHK